MLNGTITKHIHTQKETNKTVDSVDAIEVAVKVKLMEHPFIIHFFLPYKLREDELYHSKMDTITTSFVRKQRSILVFLTVPIELYLMSFILLNINI